MASIVSMKALLESGVHFGHRTNKWNPAMRQYIFTERNGIHIIDLQQTVKTLNQAYNKVVQTIAEGGTVLFVGTKRQAQETIRDEATRAGMPYVTERWLGGTLTNWVTIFDRIQELERLERMRDSGEINRLTKKEALMIERTIERLTTRLSGLRNMKTLPNLLFVVDISREDTAVHEANLKDVPVIALVDTNCDPSKVDYVIPSNDDAIRAIKLLVGKIADAVLEGKALRKEEESEAEAALAEQRAPAQRPSRQAELEVEELDDESLLGAATLAKMGGRAEEVEEEVEEVEEAAEEKAVETETVEETVEAAAEESVDETVIETVDETVDETVEATAEETVEDLEEEAEEEQIEAEEANEDEEEEEIVRAEAKKPVARKSRARKQPKAEEEAEEKEENEPVETEE